MELSNFRFALAVFLLVCSTTLPAMVSASLGINYGQLGDNLPPPENVVHLIQSIGAKKVKIYDTNPLILRAFANTGIELIVEIPNGLLPEMQDPQQAMSWVTTNVQAFLPATKITGIIVGNELLGSNNDLLSNSIVPAMQSINNALRSSGLDKQVFVTTAHSYGIMDSSFPPSAGAFKQNLLGILSQIVEFHVQTGSPFFVNIYPYFSYQANPQQIPLAYALSNPNNGYLDPNTNLHYDNLLFAQIDAVHSALSALGHKEVSVCISETGWPSRGDANEVGATLQNAATYNGNLIRMAAQNKVTPPLKPSSDLDVYIFALFNENKKPGPTSERNFGLFNPDMSPVYPLGTISEANSSFSIKVERSSAIKKYGLLLFTSLVATSLCCSMSTRTTAASIVIFSTFTLFVVCFIMSGMDSSRISN